MSKVRNHLSHEMQQLLKRLLLTISKGEKSIEKQRQKLASLEYFEPYAAFMRIDRDQNSLINSVEILRFLRDNGVEEATEADCFLIVKYFDSDDDGNLNFQDFLQIFMPCDNHYLRAIIAQRPNYAVSKNDYLGREIESEITKLLEKEIAFNRVTEEIKQTMESCKQFDYERAFNSIDDWNYGYIDKKNLKSFLKKHGYVASDEDVVAIIRRLDLDADARLSKPEFIEGIKPEEPYSKMMKRQTFNRRKESQKTPTFKHNRQHSTKSSFQNRADELLLLSEKQKDTIRTQALDRSISKITSRSPLKSRPVIRDFDDTNTRFFQTPKSTQKNRSIGRTPASQRSQRNLSISKASARRKSNTKQDNSVKRIKYSQNNSKPLSIKKSARKIKASFKNTSVLRKSSHKREDLIAQSFLNRSGITHNQKQKKDNDYEPISRSFLEKVEFPNDSSAVNMSTYSQTTTSYVPQRLKRTRNDDSSISPKRSINDFKYQEYSRPQPHHPHDHTESYQRRESRSPDYSSVRKKGPSLNQHDLTSQTQDSLFYVNNHRDDNLSSSFYNLEASSMMHTKSVRFENKHTRQDKQFMIDVLNEFIRIEKNVEKMKTEMAIKEDFNLIDAFGVLDLTGKGYITPTELREALLDIGMRCSMDEIHLVFERLNLMNDGQLKYSEFSENMMPMDQHYSRLLGTKKLTFSSKPGRCPFSMETLNKYLQLWEVIIQNEKAAEHIRHKIQNRYKFDLRSIFKMIDINNDDFLNSTEIRQLMYDMDTYVTVDDLQLILNRFDKNKDGKISYAEFERELSPKSPFSYY